MAPKTKTFSLLDPDGPPYDQDEVGRLLHLRDPKNTLWVWRRTGEGPPYFRRGSKGSRVLYERRTFWEWFNARTFRSESEAADARG